MHAGNWGCSARTSDRNLAKTNTASTYNQRTNIIDFPNVKQNSIQNWINLPAIFTEQHTELNKPPGYFYIHKENYTTFTKLLLCGKQWKTMNQKITDNSKSRGLPISQKLPKTKYNILLSNLYIPLFIHLV